MSIISQNFGLALAGGLPIAPRNSFPLDRPDVSQEVRTAVLQTLNSACWSMFTSDEIELFEEEFATYVGAKYCILVNSCTTAIYAALLSCGIVPGDRVAVPGYTYVGTCLPVVAAGATPVFIDIDAQTQSMSVDMLRKELKKGSVAAVIQAHLFGRASEQEEIFNLCQEHGIAYISDCAQLLGSKEVTSHLVNLGPCCFSFGESKILRIGEGGAVATNSEVVAEKVRLVRHEGEAWLRHGKSRIAGFVPTPDDVIYNLASVGLGMNLRPSAMLASLGRAKLRELPGVLRQIRGNALLLLDHLSNVDTISLPSDINRTWWTFPIIVDSNFSRDTVLAALLAEGIPAGVHFPRLINDHPVFGHNKEDSNKSFAGAFYFSSNHIVLPIYASLAEDHMRLIANGVQKVLMHHKHELFKLSSVAKDFLRDMPISELCSGMFMYLDSNDRLSHST